MPLIYPPDLQEHLIGRMLGPGAATITSLADETGIGESTLFRWRSRARSVGAVTEPKPRRDAANAAGPRRPQDWSPEERLRAVIESAAVPDGDLGPWLRSRGLHEATLAQWREAALRGLGAAQRTAAPSAEARRTKELERELRRKEKALAEAAALLVLRGKVQALLEEEGGSTAET